MPAVGVLKDLVKFSSRIGLQGIDREVFACINEGQVVPIGEAVLALKISSVVDMPGGVGRERAGALGVVHLIRDSTPAPRILATPVW